MLGRCSVYDKHVCCSHSDIVFVTAAAAMCVCAGLTLRAWMLGCCSVSITTLRSASRSSRRREASKDRWGTGEGGVLSGWLMYLVNGVLWGNSVECMMSSRAANTGSGFPMTRAFYAHQGTSAGPYSRKHVCPMLMLAKAIQHCPHGLVGAWWAAVGGAQGACCCTQLGRCSSAP